MNGREGMRRVGLAFGIIGGLAGSLFAYNELDDTLRQRERAQSFAALLTTPPAHVRIPPDTSGRSLTVDFQSDPDNRGISTIDYSRSAVDQPFEIDSFEKASGEHIRKTDFPPFSDYLFVAVIPMLGFLVPWGLMKALAWVGAGFLKST
jgi:hypothetical protein